MIQGSETLTDTAYWGRQSPVTEWPAKPVSVFQPLFDEWLPRGDGCEALEIGAYPGMHLAALCRSHGYRPVALDFLPRIHDLASAFRKAGLPDVETIQADFLEWKPPRKYAVVMSFGFLEHFTDPKDVLLRHWDAVADGGSLLVSTPLFGPWQWRLRMCIYDAANRKGIHDTHQVDTMRPGALERLCGELPDAQILFVGPFGHMYTWFGYSSPYVRVWGLPVIAFWKAVAWLPRLLKKSSYRFSPFAVMIARKHGNRARDQGERSGPP